MAENNNPRHTPDRKPQTAEADRLKLLLEVNNAIVSHLDLHALFGAISACLRPVVDYDVAGLALYDSENEQLRIHVFEGDVEGVGSLAEGLQIPVTEETPAGVVFNSRRARVFRLEELESVHGA